MHVLNLFGVVLCPGLAVTVCVSVQGRRGDLEETVAESDRSAGAVWPTYRSADGGSKTRQTLGFV